MASLTHLMQMMADLSEIFRAPLSARAMELYVEILGDLSSQEIATARRTLLRDHPRYFPTPAEIRRAASDGGSEELLALPAPEHCPFPDDGDHRSLEEVATERRRLAPLWGEVRRVANGGGLRPFAEVLAECSPTHHTQTAR
jgi:hypothetical protein